jgi:hypothetical protein
MSEADYTPQAPQETVDHTSAPPLRIMAVVALSASIGLLLAGRRRAGVAVAAVGTALALMEDPDTLSRWWCELPSFIGKSQQVLDRVEQVVENFSESGTQLRNLVAKVTNRQGEPVR